MSYRLHEHPEIYKAPTLDAYFQNKKDAGCKIDSNPHLYLWLIQTKLDSTTPVHPGYRAQ